MTKAINTKRNVKRFERNTYKRKKEEIRLCPLTKAPFTNLWQKPPIPKAGKLTTHKRHQKFDNTAITDRLSYYSHPSGVVNRFTGTPSHSPQQPCNKKDTRLKIIN